MKGVRSGVERRRGRGLKAGGVRRDAPGKVLKKRRSPRERGRTGTSVQNAPPTPPGSASPPRAVSRARCAPPASRRGFKAKGNEARATSAGRARDGGREEGRGRKDEGPREGRRRRERIKRQRRRATIDRRRACASTASTTVFTMSFSRVTFSQKSFAPSASACVLSNFSASSTRTRNDCGTRRGEGRDDGE